MTSIGWIYLDFLKFKYHIGKLGKETWWFKGGRLIRPAFGIIRKYYNL